MRRRLILLAVLCSCLLAACKAEPMPTALSEPPAAEDVAPQGGVSETSPVSEAPELQASKPPEQNPNPPEQPSAEERTCTLSVRCDTIWENPERLNPRLSQILPQDGAIYAEQTVSFSEGESAFDLLQRELRAKAIPLEFSKTPVYDSVYVEGIGNLYEFDCGELSGWMFRVNGAFLNAGASEYLLQTGDRVEWVYTCDLGADVGQ